MPYNESIVWFSQYVQRTIFIILYTYNKWYIFTHVSKTLMVYVQWGDYD